MINIFLITKISQRGDIPINNLVYCKVSLVLNKLTHWYECIL